MQNEKRLGALMIADGLITKDQLESALEEQNIAGEPLGKILIKMGYASEEVVSKYLAGQAGIKIVKLEDHVATPGVLNLIPYSFARTYNVFPLHEENGCLDVATADPFDIVILEEIERLTNLRIDLNVATKSDIEQAIERFYGSNQEEHPEPDEHKPKESTDVEGKVLSVTELMDRLFLRAIKERASDIHIEPKEDEIQCRFRIDGILHERPSLNKNLQSAIITRIKIMANLDISESRLSQDGKIIFTFDKKTIDIRVSTIIGAFGENIVLRLLDKENMVVGLERLGFNATNLESFRNAILKSYGIILVTGPTGSGKTTTLYSSLSYVNSKEKKIMTLEDPIEYEIPDFCQAQINVKTGFTYESGLRSILRQDPDVILVGEMRDTTTVEVSMRAANTGHLVFSTLHTNDAASAITRLRDMGAESHLLASSLIAVIGQRLLRRICPKCKEKATPNINHLNLIRKLIDNRELDYYHGKGCDHCLGTGYRGRIGIFEVLSITPSIASLISKNEDSKIIEKNAREEGMIMMAEDGIHKVSEGITTLDEVIRVANV